MEHSPHTPLYTPHLCNPRPPTGFLVPKKVEQFPKYFPGKNSDVLKKRHVLKNFEKKF